MEASGVLTVAFVTNHLCWLQPPCKNRHLSTLQSLTRKLDGENREQSGTEEAAQHILFEDLRTIFLSEMLSVRA